MLYLSFLWKLIFLVGFWNVIELCISIEVQILAGFGRLADSGLRRSILEYVEYVNNGNISNNPTNVSLSRISR